MLSFRTSIIFESASDKSLPMMPSSFKAKIIKAEIILLSSDNLIDNVHKQKEPKKVEWLKNTIYNKATYNSFMSEYVTYLPNIIWIFTTNKNKEYFSDLDESYTNSNRIDYIREIFKEA